MLRAPMVTFALMGNAAFISTLIMGVFGGIGQGEIDFMNKDQTMKTMTNWIGFAAYLNQDCFASSFFSNIVSLPVYAPVFRREHASGLYSVHMYYFGNWLSKLMTVGFYPVMLISIIFYSLDLVDSSTDNYLAFLKCGAL